MGDRRQAGAFPRLAHLFFVCERAFAGREMFEVGVSETTFSRYYGQHFRTEPVIRVSDHDKGYAPARIEVDLIINENMSDAEARQAAEETLREFEVIDRED